MGRSRVIVLRALGLGDLLTAVPALRAVRRGFADHEIILLTPRSLEPLVRHAGLADTVVPVEAKDALPAALPPIDDVAVAIDLHGRGPHSHRLLLGLGPRRLVAFTCPPVHEGLVAWRDDEHEVHRWVRLLTAEGFPADPGDLAVEPPDVRAAAAVAGATLLHPGASARSRQWPPPRWAELAAAERAAGHRVVLTAGPGERRLAADVAARAGLRPADVITPADALDLLALVAAADAVVVGDTGVAHVATAVGTPSVVLFGPTSPARWGPPDLPRHRALWAGRHGDPHADRPDDGLLAIGVLDVRHALADVRRNVSTEAVHRAPGQA